MTVPRVKWGFTVECEAKREYLTGQEQTTGWQ